MTKILLIIALGSAVLSSLTSGSAPPLLIDSSPAPVQQQR